MVLKFKIFLGVTFLQEKNMMDNLILDSHIVFIELLEKCHLFPSAIFSDSCKKNLTSYPVHQILGYQCPLLTDRRSQILLS